MVHRNSLFEVVLFCEGYALSSPPGDTLYVFPLANKF